MAVWPIHEQYRPHRPQLSQALLKARRLGLNQFGRPEGVFRFGKGVNEVEIAVDLDLRKEKTPEGVEVIIVVGVNLLCPRCTGSLYVHGPHHPNGRVIHVHWERMTQSEHDLLWRPPITIEGPIACDYFWEEINGIVAPKLVSKCGWRGVVELGWAYETSVRAPAAPALTTSRAVTEPASEAVIPTPAVKSDGGGAG